MSGEQPDESQKTEEPTPKRLREAQEKGQIAKSQEISHWFMILAFTIIVGYLAPTLAEAVSSSLVGFLARPHAIPLGPGELANVLRTLLGSLAAALLMPVGVAILAAGLSGLLQSGTVLSLEPIQPKLSKISPKSGLKKLFSSRALVDFLKGVLKIVVVGTAVTLVLWPEQDLIPMIPQMEMPRLLATMQGLGLRVLITVLAIMTVIAALDYLYQKHKHLKELRMSRQELKDEYKQTEGDPLVKARLRQIRTERARQRMMAAVPEADVVVTNPTHFAVALKYEPGKSTAPKVTAKGVDSLAQRMRELAEAHDVPLVENPPLARALHASVKLDQEIPTEHYKAVAEIIGYVWRLKGRMPAGRGRA